MFEDPHSLPNWALSFPISATDVWLKDKAVGTRLSQMHRRKDLIGALAVVCSELRTKLLVLTFYPALGEGESGLSLGLNRHPDGREGLGFLGEDKGHLGVPKRSVGSSSAVWDL